MSEQRFKEARGQLAFSQSLVDKMKQEQAPQIDEQQGMAPQAPQETPQQPQEQGDIKSTIEETLTPFMDKIESLLSKEDEKVRQVEIKLDGEMQPAKE